MKTATGECQKPEMVGATGFEPATSCSQSKCSTRLSYAPTRRHCPDFPPPRNKIPGQVLLDDSAIHG